MSDSNTRSVVVEWQGGMRFSGGSPGGPSLLIDADEQEAPGPMRTLLLAAAACSGADLVTFLAKMEVRLTGVRTLVEGQRRAEFPRRYVSIHFRFELAGEGLDEIKARRAIDLSLTKYCSVVHSLNPDIPITYDLALASA